MFWTKKNSDLKTYNFSFAAQVVRSSDGEPHEYDMEKFLIDLCDELDIEIVKLSKVKWGYIIHKIMGALSYWGFKGKIKVITTKEKYKEFYFAFNNCDDDFYFVKFPSYKP